jgi:hypothetical protein
MDYDLSELDQREREFWTLLRSGKTFIFLVQYIPKDIQGYPLEPQSDLFRRVLHSVGIAWSSRSHPVPCFDCGVAEFKSYLEKHGTAYVLFRFPKIAQEDLTVITGSDQDAAAFALHKKLFFLPCHQFGTHEKAVEIAIAAVQSVMAYRQRVSEELPSWVDAFRFRQEQTLRAENEMLQTQLLRVQSSIDGYQRLKGALCQRSEPLVRSVASVLRDFFGIRLNVNDMCIEDATLLDENDEVLAILEVKGINGSFKREHVNQVDSHRERLNLTAVTPGILIINTIMGADTLASKDEAPHPDIIAKAVAENVLLIRTLDLLRYMDLCEGGVLRRESFQETILSSRGWLRVEGDRAQVIR